MPFFRRRSPIIEARQFTGDNANELIRWAHGGTFPPQGKAVLFVQQFEGASFLLIWPSTVHEGDWVVRMDDGSLRAYTTEALDAEFIPARDPHPPTRESWPDPVPPRTI